MIRRRNFITGTAAAVLALTAGSSSAKCSTLRPSTFTDDDTLVQRTEKLNALMGANYEVDVTYPKEWETQRWGTSRNELLTAQFPRLVYSHSFEWGVYFKLNGKRCSRDMSPFEFFHWTSAIAWQYRMNHAATNSE